MEDCLPRDDLDRPRRVRRILGGDFYYPLRKEGSSSYPPTRLFVGFGFNSESLQIPLAALQATLHPSNPHPSL